MLRICAFFGFLYTTFTLAAGYLESEEDLLERPTPYALDFVILAGGWVNTLQITLQVALLIELKNKVKICLVVANLYWSVLK